MIGSQFNNQFASYSIKKYFDIIKNDDLSSLYQEIYRKIIAQDGFLVQNVQMIQALFSEYQEHYEN